MCNSLKKRRKGMDDKKSPSLSEMSSARIYNSFFKSNSDMSAFEAKKTLEAIECVKMDSELFKVVCKIKEEQLHGNKK